jgi:hypothetical protein
MAAANSSSFEYDPAADVCYRRLDFLGFPGFRVGDDGSVWTAWRLIPLGVGVGTRSEVSDAWSPLRICRVRRGVYRGISLRDRFKKGSRTTIHRLVLLAFAGPCPPGMECRHLDGNPANNRLRNVCWGTHRANIGDRGRHGTTARGERVGNAKLSDEHAAAIIPRVDSGESRTQIATEYGVSRSIISQLARGKTFKHLRRGVSL